MEREVLHLLQLELECKGVVEDDLLVRIPGEEPDDIELVQATRTSDGRCRILIRRDTAPELIAELRRLDPEKAVSMPEVIAKALGTSGLVWHRGRSYTFPPGLKDSTDAVRLMPELRDGSREEPWMNRPIFAVMVDGMRVSYCRSSRENERAAEAWVETVPEYRGRGFARSAVLAWATAVLGAGKVAFYSHDEDNAASAGVARSLRLTHWLDYVNFESESEADLEPA